MNEKMKFSVALCVYGGDNPIWLDKALESIFCQTLLPSEVVLVVDGPIPNSIEDVINKYSNKLNVFRFEQNQGHGNARRASIENCKNDIIALMDADDICLPNRFEKEMIVFKENSDIDIVGGYISEFCENEDNIVGYRMVPTSDKEFSQFIKKRCPMNQVTVMFKKSAVQEVGGYIDWFCEEDYYLWIRMYLAGKKFKNIPEVLVNVRVGKEMYQRRGGYKYFKSEKKLFKYMYDNKMISFLQYTKSVIIRFIVQVIMTNSMRQWFFKTFARKQSS